MSEPVVHNGYLRMIALLEEINGKLPTDLRSGLGRIRELREMWSPEADESAFRALRDELALVNRRLARHRIAEATLRLDALPDTIRTRCTAFCARLRSRLAEANVVLGQIGLDEGRWSTIQHICDEARHTCEVAPEKFVEAAQAKAAVETRIRELTGEFWSQHLTELDKALAEIEKKIVNGLWLGAINLATTLDQQISALARKSVRNEIAGEHLVDEARAIVKTLEPHKRLIERLSPDCLANLRSEIHSIRTLVERGQIDLARQLVGALRAECGWYLRASKRITTVPTATQPSAKPTTTQIALGAIERYRHQLAQQGDAGQPAAA